MTELMTIANDHWHHGGGAWWFLAPLFWISVWILIIVVLRGIFWRRHRRHHQHRFGWWNENDPRAILAGRFARGEIDEAEYRERLNVLDGPPRK